MDIDEAVDQLLDATSRLELPAPSEPGDVEDLVALEATIAPLRIPEAVRRFWTRLRPETLGIAPYPRFHGPAFALDSWRMARDEFYELQPLALLQIGYESHQCMSVELEQADARGGVLFEWNVVDGGFERRFDGLEDWLEYLTNLLNTGRYDDRPRGQGRLVFVPSPEDRAVERSWRPKLPEHPLYGKTTVIERDIMKWPERWQRLAGLTAETKALRGRTHTIAELMATDPGRPVEATVLGKVVSLVGVAGSGSTVQVDDGTGAVVIYCPFKKGVGPRIRSWFEFDVSLPAGPRVPPVDPDTVATDEPDPDQQFVERFVAKYAQPASAIATAVRRAPEPR